MRHRPSKQTIRVITGLIAGICLMALIGSALVAGSPGSASHARESTAIGSPVSAFEPTADSPPREPLTVVTTQGFYLGTHPGERDVAELVVFDRDGQVVYLNRTHEVYFDVDPVPGTRYTVEYVAANRVGSDACSASQCTMNLVERLNLSTGEVTRVYDEITPQFESGRWHDVDRVNETHLVVADIVEDRVYMVDVRSDEITWQWNASDHYPPEAGGLAGDWTHVNDVEVLPDGRIMASMRNMDEVVFIDPGNGLVDEWTLGADDDYSTLYEQHNPDYLPTERGGPAVIVADSENNRVIEYHRTNGQWTAAWSWRDPALQWPRDADRLPNGNTLVVDSNGNRVVEVAPDGTVAWSVDVGRPYDAEQLGTGPESDGGYAAGASGTGPPAERQGSADGHLVVALKDQIPGILVNGILFVAPPWVRFADLLVALVLLVDLAVWGSLEWRWSGRSARDGIRWLRERRG